MFHKLSYNINTFHRKIAEQFFAGEQRRGMKSNLKGQKILIMPLLFLYRKNRRYLPIQREDKNKKLILTNDFELHIIEMKKAKEILGNNKDDKVAQWMSFFDNPNSMEVKNMSENNQDINEALEQLRKLSANKQLREMLDREERYERDRRAEMQYAKEEAQEEGLAKGRAENKREVIVEMLKKGLPEELIAEIVHVTEKEIIEINKKLTK